MAVVCYFDRLVPDPEGGSSFFHRGDHFGKFSGGFAPALLSETSDRPGNATGHYRSGFSGNVDAVVPAAGCGMLYDNRTRAAAENYLGAHDRYLHFRSGEIGRASCRERV